MLTFLRRQTLSKISDAPFVYEHAVCHNMLETMWICCCVRPKPSYTGETTVITTSKSHYENITTYTNFENVAIGYSFQFYKDNNVEWTIMSQDRQNDIGTQLALNLTEIWTFDCLTPSLLFDFDYSTA